jgi:aldehyde:ferredoxin oxidoreductase
MKGYNGRILRVNLTRQDHTVESPPEEFYRKYLGGRGFIIHTLLSETPKGIDPLGPENKLIFATGPITGYPLPGGVKTSVGSKSPLTGAPGESEAGGSWGTALKKAGFDAIIIEGAAPAPVYISIRDDRVEVRDGRHTWGLEPAETEKTLREELGDGKMGAMVIGPGGENLVRYASILGDVTHVAGRTGMGAVMGSKKLKAIAVRGTKLPEMANREGIRALARWMAENYKKKTHLWEQGTGTTMVQYEEQGNLPIRNFLGGRFPGAGNINSQTMFNKGYVTKMEGCLACPIRCKKKIEMKNPWTVDPAYGGPEYETLAALGSNCGVDSVEAIIKAHELCGRYGIDTMSAGVSISFAMECFEKGIITLQDTGGIHLTFGNAEAMVEMVEQIGRRKGFGDVLAEGARRAAAIIGKGADEYAMHVKGEEIPMHEPRYKQGMGLHYTVHPMGPDHCGGPHDDVVQENPAGWDSVDVSDPMPSTELSARKARMLYHTGLWRQMGNYLGTCSFVPWNYKQLCEATEYVTGWPISYWRLMKTVERGVTLARIYNIREGFTTKDDTLPGRFMTSPPDGPLKGISIDPGELADAQKVYYQMLGWDESGVPTYGRLVELGIEWAWPLVKE